jgi:hypothetical protein
MGVSLNSDVVFDFQTKEPVGALMVSFQYSAYGSGEADCLLAIDPPPPTAAAGLPVTILERKVPLKENTAYIADRRAKHEISAVFRWFSKPEPGATPTVNGGPAGGQTAPPKESSSFRASIALPTNFQVEISNLTVGIPQ